MARLPDPPVLPVDPFADRLIVIYQEAERALDALIAAAANRGAKGTDRYFTNQQARVSSILRQLRRRAAPLRPALARSAYRTGVSAIDRVLDRSEAFSGVHTAAEEVVAANLEGRLRYAEERIGRAAEDALRRIALEEVGIAIAAGLSPRQQARRLEGRLRNLDHAQIRKDGGTAFVDRRGRRWRLGVYSAMVCRTTTREAVSVGMKNRLIEHGRDLVMISEHRRSCPICLPFQGKTFSLTGASSPQYPELEELPPFHPNCRHVLLPARVSFEEMEAALGLGPEGGGGISDALEPRTRILKGTVETASEAIDSVHEVPALPRIPVRPDDGRLQARGADAAVVRDRSTPDRVEMILVNSGTKDELNLVHEIGHFLDIHAFETKTANPADSSSYFESNSGTMFADVLRVADRTDAIAKFKLLRRTARTSNRRATIDYFLKPHEIVARAYAQWIAIRSNNPRLLNQLRSLQGDDYGPMQWQDSDFTEIAEAFDQAFRNRGWLK